MNLITLMSLKLVNTTKLCSIAKYNERTPPYAPTKQNHDEGEQMGGTSHQSYELLPNHKEGQTQKP
jgi:hypothetical protein